MFGHAFFANTAYRVIKANFASVAIETIRTRNNAFSTQAIGVGIAIAADFDPCPADAGRMMNLLAGIANARFYCAVSIIWNTLAVRIALDAAVDSLITKTAFPTA